MSCSHVKNCELFVQFALNPALEVWKDHYCEGDHTRCARYQRSNASQPVPLTLLPNGKIVSITTSTTSGGEITLFNAILKNRVRMVSSMLKIGVDINAKNIQGITPLMAATEHGYTEIVQFLLDHGADINIRNLDGDTACDIALAAGHNDIATLLQQRGATPPTTSGASAANSQSTHTR